ncbi:hypothetical protein OOK31_25620 [Streptomyces sp. NBC_00249]|uniref:hypothetical protein n=1 Tax=Streptomyces sp. NBC_00249 TaxID=2975690 RepID=UPI00224EEC8C|nr:hypothetical protein [Streptomyces sp. NBC_00249]MCX5197237.1 hypothetical protein [Streptomyces sp. NBC_00249]
MARRTVTGRVDDLFTDAAAAGVAVTLSAMPRRWTDEAGGRVLAAPDHPVVVTAGAWSASLLPTDEPGIEPATGRYYRVTESVAGVPVRVRVFEVPTGVGSVGIDTLVVADPGLPGYVRGTAGPKGDTGDTGPQGPQPPLGAAGAGAGIALRSTDPTTTDARTPTAHAASHAAAGADALTLTQAQVTGLAAALAGLLPLTGGTMTGTVTNNAASAATTAYGGGVVGDTFDRWRILASGAIELGPGNAARDTNLRRSAANELTTDDALIVALMFRHMGSTLGFYGAAAVARPSITGSRGGNSALGSLISALAAIGLVTDTTTA